MKLTILAVATGVAAGFSVAPSALAQEGFYVGGGYSMFQTDNGVAEEFNLGAVTGRLGYHFNPFVAVEGELAVGLDDEQFHIVASGSGGGVNVTAGLDTEVGAFAVGRLPIPAFGGVFGRIGYANISIDASGPNRDLAGGDGSGLAYGGGVQFGLLAFRARAEYTRYETDDDSVDSFGVSGLLQF